SLVKAVDFDGSSVTLGSGDFTVTITDDAPVLTSGASAVTGTVNEGGLVSASSADLYGSGNEHTSATSATGGLSGLVRVGAHRPRLQAHRQGRLPVHGDGRHPRLPGEVARRRGRLLPGHHKRHHRDAHRLCGHLGERAGGVHAPAQRRRQLYI